VASNPHKGLRINEQGQQCVYRDDNETSTDETQNSQSVNLDFEFSR